MNMLMELLHLFFPDSCLVCGTHLMETEQIVCLSCSFELPFTEYTDFPDNPFEKKFRGRIPIEAATALLFFRKKGNTQVLIHKLKYHGYQKIGTLFGSLLGKDIQNSTRFQNLDAIVMVPLHPEKMKKRGYNQLTFFANQLAIELQIPVWDDVLIKTYQTESQTHKNKLNRFDKINEKFQGVQLDKLKGKHILLIDDVLTTGATLEACAHELLKVPLVKISLATMAVPDY